MLTSAAKNLIATLTFAGVIWARPSEIELRPDVLAPLARPAHPAGRASNPDRHGDRDRGCLELLPPTVIASAKVTSATTAEIGSCSQAPDTAR
jgi:hypothetical protein